MELASLPAEVHEMIISWLDTKDWGSARVASSLFWGSSASEVRRRKERILRRIYGRSGWIDVCIVGDLRGVRWLDEHRKEGCTTNAADAMDLAASYGHLEVVKWLDEHRHERCTSDTRAVPYLATCN